MIHIDEDGMWIENDSFENAVKMDTPGVMKKLREKKNGK